MARVAVTVSITPPLAEFVASEVKSGRYQTASEVVRAALFDLKTKRERHPRQPVTTLKHPSAE